MWLSSNVSLYVFPCKNGTKISPFIIEQKRNRNTFSVLRLLYQLKFHIVFYSFQADGKAYRKTFQIISCRPFYTGKTVRGTLKCHFRLRLLTPYPICTLSTMDCGFISSHAFLILLAPRTLALFRYASRKSV